MIRAFRDGLSASSMWKHIEVGNNTVEADGEFGDGYSNGNLYYYDTNHQLPRPFTSEAVYAFMMANLSDQRATARWNAGFVFGWITALCENNPAFFFTSITIPQSVSVTEALPIITCKKHDVELRRASNITRRSAFRGAYVSACRFVL